MLLWNVEARSEVSHPGLKSQLSYLLAVLPDTLQILWYSTTQDMELNHHPLPWVWGRLADSHPGNKIQQMWWDITLREGYLKTTASVMGVLSHSFAVESLTLGTPAAMSWGHPSSLWRGLWGGELIPTIKHKSKLRIRSSPNKPGGDCSPNQQLDYNPTRGPGPGWPS